MERQLALIDEPGSDYRLDDNTREVGRRGVAAAREALRKADRDTRDEGSRPSRRSAA